MNEQTAEQALASGYTLHWYRIERVLGQGAFGITYLALDVNLDRQVAIKEFLPGQFSMRNSDMTVRPVSADKNEDFQWGLQRFISEARTLTRFEHPNLVRVLNVFEMNNTAYMVMNYEVGKSLQQILKSRKTLNETELKKILAPLMSGLELMHGKGFVHRDIKPGNIFIRSDGSPVLLDFGSARQTRSVPGRDGGKESLSLTTLVSPGYAPIEQYGSRGDRQGPWTDIYGLGATLYRAVSGVMPVAAVDRGEAIVHDSKDPYLPLSDGYQDQYSRDFLAAIDHAMAFKAQHRPQTIDAWRREFAGGTQEAGALLAPAAPTDSEAVTLQPETPDEITHKLSSPRVANMENTDNQAIHNAPPAPDKRPRFTTLHKILIAASACALVALGVFLISGHEEENTATAETTPAAPPDQASAPAAESPAATTATENVPQAADTDATRQTQIQELLAKAQDDMTAMRLTNPKDNSAFDKYLAVLKLDENNDAAQAGIQSISDKYVAMSYTAMNAGNFDKASTYLAKAGAITPDSKKVATAQEALQAKRAEQASAPAAATEPSAENQEQAATPDNTETKESDAGFWDKVKQWNAEQEEKSKHLKQEESATDKQIKRGFGVQ